jgi:hypothetical protein
VGGRLVALIQRMDSDSKHAEAERPRGHSKPVSCVAMVDNGRTRSRQISEVARCIASRVPSGIGIGSLARLRIGGRISFRSRSRRVALRISSGPGSKSRQADWPDRTCHVNVTSKPTSRGIAQLAPLAR